MRQPSWIKLIVFTAMSLLLISCETYQERSLQLRQKPARDTSYYPYLSEDQYQFLHKQNVIGLSPGTTLIPARERATLEYELNATSWWGTWPQDVVFINYFLAEQAKRRLGCGPLAEGTNFTLARGIYTFKQKKISVPTPIIWTLTTNVDTICLTKSYLPSSFYQHDDIYWAMSYSQNRISP